jgi:hypothetical protein
VKHLLEDLNDWTTIYVAGRMQKPVRTSNELLFFLFSHFFWLADAGADFEKQRRNRTSEHEKFGLGYGCVIAHATRHI